MTLSSTNNLITYTGDGLTLPAYSYSFRILDEDDLTVTVRNTADPAVETELTKTTHYTVTGVGAVAGGTVVLVPTVAFAWINASGFLEDDYVLCIRRKMDLTQATDIRNQGPFYPAIHEDQFDRLVMIDQQQQTELDRSVRLMDSVLPATFDPKLPAELVGEASVALVTNATGDGWDVGPTVTAISTAAANAAAAAASAAAALVSETNAAASEAAAAASASSSSNLGIDSQFKVFADSPITLVSGDRGKIISCDCTSGNIAITLPAIAGLSLTAPFSLVIKKTDSTASTVTITRASTDTIDGATSVTLESQYEGVFLFAEDSTSPDKWTMVKFGASSGGGGGSSLKWIASTNAPTEIVENNLVVQEFDPDTQQEIYAMIKVPQTYVAGRQIKLWFDFYSAGTANTVLLKTTATLIRKATDAVTSTTNQYSSTNSAVTLSAGTVDEPQEVSADLTSSTGQINSVSVSPGDRIFIKLFRDVATDTATATAKALLDGSEVTFR